ncbi:MAG TPA: response regulator transcription factor [Pseudomonadales bacterium]|nr:response regulator transcription factor [Pseudomonadales bacterium]
MANVVKSDFLVRVAIVDDDEGTRLCFKDILQGTKNFHFAGSCSNAAEALTNLPLLQPDLTLMDIRMPDMNGIECTKRLRHIMPRLKIVIVTGTHETRWVSASLQAGATAYLVKPIEGDQLLATLQFAANQTGTSADISPIASGRMNWQLSPREKEVLTGLADGLLYKEISQKLGISYSAVHKYQHNIFRKLQVSNRSEAIRIWLDNQKS